MISESFTFNIFKMKIAKGRMHDGKMPSNTFETLWNSDLNKGSGIKIELLRVLLIFPGKRNIKMEKSIVSDPSSVFSLISN